MHRNTRCNMNVIADKISTIQAYFCVNTWELALSPGLDWRALKLLKMPAALWGKYRTKEYISLGQKAGGSAVFKLSWPWPFSSCHIPFPFIDVYGWGRRGVFTSAEFACHAASSAVQPSPAALPSHLAATVCRKSWEPESSNQFYGLYSRDH